MANKKNHNMDFGRWRIPEFSPRQDFKKFMFYIKLT